LADRRDNDVADEPEIQQEQRTKPVAMPFVPRTGSGFVNSWR
jgi:hypothetical protein